MYHLAEMTIFSKSRFYSPRANLALFGLVLVNLPSAFASAPPCPTAQAVATVHGSPTCVCPNINEIYKSTSNTCVSAIAPSPFLVKATYYPYIFDTQDQLTSVMNRNDEPLDTLSKVLGYVEYPQGNPYTRKIWLCAPPSTLNTNYGTCTAAPKPELHACDDGNVAVAEPASPVSSSVAAGTDSLRFLSVANKKLACCLNDFGTTFASIKFDCIENVKNYGDFNELWQSYDTNDGNQIAALMLTNAVGKIVTGFYTLKGARCDEFSEFADDIQPGLVNGKLSANIPFQPKGTIIPHPSLSVKGFAQIRHQVQGAGKRVPSTDVERKRCPILIRAAIEVTCPPTSNLPVVSKTYEEHDAAGRVTGRRCSSASSIMTHVRMEQVYEISESPLLPMIDTISNSAMPTSVSVERIILNKYGSNCPPGTARVNGVCSF